MLDRVVATGETWRGGLVTRLWPCGDYRRQGQSRWKV